MRDPNDDDDIDRAYGRALEATEDQAAALRRRAAVLQAVRGQHGAAAARGDGRAAANEARWRPAGAWARGAAAACLMLSSALVVTHLGDEPDVATSPAPPASAQSPQQVAVAPAAPARPPAAAVATHKARAAAPREPVAPEPARATAETAALADAAPAARTEAPALRRTAAATATATAGPAPAGAPAPAGSLLAAVGKGDLEGARQILRGTGADTERDADGRTALAVAVLRADLPLVKLLLAHGAQRQAQDRYGQTPQAYAESSGNAALVQALARP
jgi:hypothetical protein